MSRRVNLAIWIVPCVIAAHALFFWAVWDKHYLPKVPPPPATPPRPNFVERRTERVDPRTGAVVIEHDFTISTHLATPVPSATVSGSP